MKILVTGSNGFVGKNLIWELKNQGYKDILEYSRENTIDDLEKYTKECDFVYHLAGVNRPENKDEYMKGNYGFTSKLLELLKKNKNKSPVVITSSTQAELDNPYGKSKKAGEELIFDYGKENNVDVYVYRLTNLFGKWSKPNYNSVVSTFCYNIANNKDIKIDNKDIELRLCYIDDVLNEFINILKGKASKKGRYYIVKEEYTITLGKLADLIMSFKESRELLTIPNMNDELTKKLYSTYLSYLPQEDFSYELKMNKDERGSFTEFIRTEDRGQVSVNISKPGITKGNHWHHSKNEKFLVVKGEGVIKFRDINTDKIIEYKVSGEKLEVVDIPTGYTHNIINTGNEDMVTIMWVNEPFNPDVPDTYFMEV